MREYACVLLAVVALSLVACANIQTIGRRTTLPAPKSNGAGKAIHLDAQQRLVVVNKFQKFCAEPSPDALAAYASSLGLGVTAPSQGSGSLANSLQSSAGSIGLRTQSITLMRDALYRMCEAYVNDALGPVQVATLLGRSQDLTAVILAVEQLTGVVAANQIILTGSTGAGASASLLSNQQLLDAARKDEEAKQKTLDDAKASLETKKTEVNTRQGNYDVAKSSYTQAAAPGSNVDAQTVASLKSTMDIKDGDLKKAQAEHKAAGDLVKTREELLAESRQTRETIESAKDSALTNAVANTSSSGQFSVPVQTKELSKEATEAIASAVQEMVKTVLNKTYSEDSCMALLTTVPRGYDEWLPDQKVSYERVRDLCMQLVSKSLFQAIVKDETTFAPDSTSDQIERALKDNPALQQRLVDWLRTNGQQMSTTFLIYGGEFKALRERAIKELAIE